MLHYFVFVQSFVCLSYQGLLFLRILGRRLGAGVIFALVQLGLSLILSMNEVVLSCCVKFSMQLGLEWFSCFLTTSLHLAKCFIQERFRFWVKTTCGNNSLASDLLSVADGGVTIIMIIEARCMSWSSQFLVEEFRFGVSKGNNSLNVSSKFVFISWLALWALGNIPLVKLTLDHSFKI